MFVFNQFIHQLQHPMVRDLYWLCYAPEIMAHNVETMFKRPEEDWFIALEIDPSPLTGLLAQRNLYLLGSYFEALWEFLLTWGPHTQLAAKNIQILSGEGQYRKTLGELDFIYYCQQRQCHVHLEVAIKFYLAFVPCDISAAAESDVNEKLLANHYWIGPQANDRLDIKWEKLVNKQSPLSNTLPAQVLLEQQGIVVKQQEIAMPGFLFTPCNEELTTDNANSNHLQGLHCRFSDFNSYGCVSDQWLILDKPYWLADPAQCLLERALTAKALSLSLAAHFLLSDRAVMLFSYSALTNTGVHRMVVTCDAWPLLTKATAHLFDL